MAVEWSITDEIRLFRWAAEFKPAGLHKHFHMMCIMERMNRPDKYPVTLLQNDSIKLGKTFTSKDIWEKLGGYYNLEEMDKLEYQVPKIPAVPNDGKDDGMLQHRYQLTHKRDFELTWDEYGELILDNARDGVEEDEEDKNSQATMEGIDKPVLEDFSNKGLNSEATGKGSGETFANSVRTRRSSRLRKSSKPNRDKSDQSDDENDANDTHTNENNDNDKGEKTKMEKLEHEDWSGINASVRSSKNKHSRGETSGDADINDKDASLNNANVIDLHDNNSLDADFRDSGLKKAPLKDADVKTADSKNTDFTDISLENPGSHGSDFQDSEEKDVGVEDADVRDAHVQDANSREASAKAGVSKNFGSKDECDKSIEGSASTGLDHMVAFSTDKGYTKAAPSEAGLKEKPTKAEETASSGMVPEKSAVTNAYPSKIDTSEKLSENKDQDASGSHMTVEKGQNSDVAKAGCENAQNRRNEEEGKAQGEHKELNDGGNGSEQKNEFDSEVNSVNIESSTGNAPLNSPNEETTYESAAPNDEVAEEKTNNGQINEAINQETDQNPKDNIAEQEENSENEVEGISPQNQDEETPHMAEEDSAQAESASQPMARRTRHSAAVTPALNETSPKRKKRNTEQPVPHTGPKRTSTRVSSRLRNRK